MKLHRYRCFGPWPYRYAYGIAYTGGLSASVGTEITPLLASSETPPRVSGPITALAPSDTARSYASRMRSASVVVE